jgi:type II secretory pathway pseudopilin PulG
MRPCCPQGSEDGFTVIELLLTLVVLLVVLFAVFSTFDAFSAGSASNSRLTQAQDDLRSKVDAMTRSLRNATPITSTLPAIVRPAPGQAGNDIVFSSFGDGTSTTGRYSRFCVDTSTQTLWATRSPSSTYSDPGSACPGTWSASLLLRGGVTNSTSAPLFAVDSGGRTVGIGLRAAVPRAGGGSGVLTLSTSAFLRSGTGRAPNLSAADVAVTCTTVNGSKKALLQLGVGVGGGDPLVASYAIANVPIGTGAVQVAADAPVQVAVTVTDLLGLKQLLVKTVSC